ncbi:MAG: polysaccharide biosynthesis tyrosine autokinase [Actinomycetota bacterium]|nr:polysaccharide biosynthesis tyrosine autokinase [Actinomycetota bacterium]
MTLRAYLRVFRERWRLVALVTLIVVAIAVLITSATPKVYQADAQVFVASANASSTLDAAQAAVYIQTEVSTYAAIVDNPDVLHSVESDLGLTIGDQALKAKIFASAPIGQSIVLIHVKDASPAQAAAIANSASRAFIAAVEKDQTPTGSSVSSVHLFVTDPASAPTKPVSPKTALNLSVGLLLGLILGAGLAIARDVLDTRIKDADALTKISGSPLMGVIVEDPKTQRHPIATRAGTRNMRAENYRQLRANLQFANVDEHPRVIAVTSSIPGEGKTTVAINLASTLAEAGFTVCLVDADLRRPTIGTVLDLVSPVGLTSVLIHQIELSEAMQSAGANFYVLTSGPTPPNPSEVLASSYLRNVVRSLMDKVDYVVLDTAPLLPVADGAEVAALADGTLLVARHDVSTDSQIRRAVSALAHVDAKVLGVVLNRLPARRGSEYGYSYYRADNDAAAHTKGHRSIRSRRSK